MKIATLLVSTLCLASNVAFAISDDDATRFSIKTLIASDDADNIRALGDTLVRAGEVPDSATYDLVAQMLYLEMHKSRASVIKVIWYVRIIAISKDGRYRNLLQSISESIRSKRVQDETVAALAKLSASGDGFFAPGKFDLAAYRESLQGTQQSHRIADAVGAKDLSKLKKVNDTYEHLGYPDHLEMRYEFSLRMPGMGRMEAVWDNRYRVAFRFVPPKLLRQSWLGELFRDMRVVKIYPLPNLADTAAVKARLLSTDPKDAAALLHEMQSVYVVPDQLMGMFQEYIGRNAATTDRIVLQTMKRMCQWLGRSADSKYIDTLISLRQHSDRGLRIEATESLFQIYAETNNVDALYKELDDESPENARLAAKRIYAAAIYDSVTLQRLYERVQRSVSSVDPILVDAMANMLKTIGRSGEPAYREKLDEVLRAAVDEKLKKHATAARDLLAEEI